MTRPEPRPRRGAGVTPPPGPFFCTLGPRLCRLAFWTEAEWDALPPDQRPAVHERVPGLGWVAALPDQVLN